VSSAERLAALLRTAGPGGTVVFTGAGISTESGIPDFRSPGGVWSRYAPIEYAEYMRDSRMRAEAWRRGLESYPAMAEARPNAAHRALAEWWRVGVLSGIVTQNIDGLHHKAGLPDEAIVELHGNAHRVACVTCKIGFDRLAVHARVLAGEADPACPHCGGILKTTTVSFGEGLPLGAMRLAQGWHAAARLCLVIGSSLLVYPAASLPELTRQCGGQLAIVNHTETHLDAQATLVAREPAGQVLADTAAQLANLVS
jgi:NAD-dependent deacetylase